MLSKDPAKDGLNWYAYCGNSPVSKVDPTGEFALIIPVEIILYVVAAVVVITVVYPMIVKTVEYAMGNIIDFPALTRELESIFHPIPVTVYTDTGFAGRTKVKSQFEDLACEVGMTVGAAATAVLAQVQQAVGNQEKKENPNSKRMLGENGTQLDGSKTTGQNGRTERVDVENPAPGRRPGDVHYHEPNGTKWRYDINIGKLVDSDTGSIAPSRIQNVLKEFWFQKALEKALKILGE